jgi:hypothetical protein
LTRINVPTARKRDIEKNECPKKGGKRKAAKYREEPQAKDLIGLAEIDSD